MSKLRIGLLALGCVLAVPAFAVSVDQATFKKYGGNVLRVGPDIRTKGIFDPLREYSYARPWLGVGMIGSGQSVCTATWIGESNEWSYILTAAHCLGARTAASPITANFVVSGVRIAEGAGVAYVTGDRIGNASLEDVMDIAIVKLPRSRTPLDKSGVPLEKPILNDSKLEDGKTVIFVGYGDWGVGSRTSWSYLPRFGERRLYARNVARTLPDSMAHHEHGLVAFFDPYGPSENWAKLEAGDSGSAWWQFQNETLTIIGVTAKGGGGPSYAARISAYAGWIKQVYPGARLLSQEEPKACLISADTTRRTFCMGPGESSRLPDWIRGAGVDIQADSGITVTVSGSSYRTGHRLASFNGTVENSLLQRAKANNGKFVNVQRPRFMRVERINDKPLGCIVSLVSAEKYCLPADRATWRRLPAWISGHDIFVQTDPGASVILYDAQGNGARFTGMVQNHQLKKVRTRNDGDADLSQPVWISVVRQ